MIGFFPKAHRVILVPKTFIDNRINGQSIKVRTGDNLLSPTDRINDGSSTGLKTCNGKGTRTSDEGEKREKPLTNLLWALFE